MSGPQLIYQLIKGSCCYWFIKCLLQREKLHMKGYTSVRPSPLVQMGCLHCARTQGNREEAHPEDVMLRQTPDHQLGHQRDHRTELAIPLHEVHPSRVTTPPALPYTATMHSLLGIIINSTNFQRFPSLDEISCDPPKF